MIENYGFFVAHFSRMLSSLFFSTDAAVFSFQLLHFCFKTFIPRVSAQLGCFKLNRLVFQLGKRGLILFTPVISGQQPPLLLSQWYAGCYVKHHNIYIYIYYIYIYIIYIYIYVCMYCVCVCVCVNKINA